MFDWDEEDFEIFQADESTTKAWKAMVDDAKQDGLFLKLDKAYSSNPQSENHTGLAVKVDGGGVDGTTGQVENQAIYDYLENNAKQYGFVRANDGVDQTGAEGSNHFRFVGNSDYPSPRGTEVWAETNRLAAE